MGNQQNENQTIFSGLPHIQKSANTLLDSPVFIEPIFAMGQLLDFFPVGWLIVLMLGVGQNEDFLFERAVNTEFSNFLYCLAAAILPLGVLIMDAPIGSLITWITIFCITLPHLFFCQQFQFIAKQHNQLMILQGKPVPTAHNDTEEELTPFRETTLLSKIGRALVAIVLILGGLACWGYIVYQWFEQDAPLSENTDWLLWGLMLMFGGKRLLA